MIFRAFMFCLTASFVSGCSLFGFDAKGVDSIQVAVTSTDQAVEQFLSGRELDAIEGAWGHDESVFEIVITRNDFDIEPGYRYLGIITRSDQPSWHQGDVKLLLNGTSTAGVFEGVWLTWNKSRRQMTFIVENRNLIQGSFVSNDGDTYFARIRRINARYTASAN